MFNPNTTTVSDAISTIRDIGFIIAILVSGFKIRSWIQPGIEFFQRINIFMSLGETHMALMENNMRTLLTNHLSHIEADLKHLSGREIVPDIPVIQVAKEDAI